MDGASSRGQALNLAMSKRNPRSAPDARQPDLFGERALPRGSIELSPCQPDVEGMDDQEVLARLPGADLSQVQILCEQVLKRGIGDDAVPALEALWRRFFGFGIDGPLREQRCALETLAKSGTSLSRQALVGIVSAPDLFDALLPLALRCATEANLALSGRSVTCWLEDGRPEVREFAFVLARNCSPPVQRHVLEAGLLDPEASVRRACLMTLGQFGHAAAKPGLLEELERRPTGEVVTALSGMLDDDIITRLGRCAREHERLRGQVIEELEGSDDPRALRLVETLRRLK